MMTIYTLSAEFLKLALDNGTNRGSYISVHVFLQLLNELRTSDKVSGLLSIVSLALYRFSRPDFDICAVDMGVILKHYQNM